VTPELKRMKQQTLLGLKRYAKTMQRLQSISDVGTHCAVDGAAFESRVVILAAMRIACQVRQLGQLPKYRHTGFGSQGAITY
jgi:hypothetical protein